MAELETKRSCGTCTACCDAVAVQEIDKPVYTPCQHMCGTGCVIYQNRPQQCREYMCAWKTLWTPNDEQWRPDNLGAIFDMDKGAMGGDPAVRCWQLKSETQILDDPRIRMMAYAIAVQLNLPVVARFGDLDTISVHLIPKFRSTRFRLIKIKVPAFVLTPDVIPDPEDFDKRRPDYTNNRFNDFNEYTNFMSQFGTQAFLRAMGF